MAKIKNRFSEKAIISVHDNLLANLYQLDLSSVTVKVIDEEEYLINKISGRDYSIGLIAKIPTDLLTVNNHVYKFSELSTQKQEEIFNLLKDNLYFSNVEILFCNILFDRFLKTDYDYDFSLTKIEKNYRRRGKTKKIRISDVNYKRYVTTLNKLSKKEIIIDTKAKFRTQGGRIYGVNNLKIKQKLISFTSLYYKSENDIIFSYHFSQFGKVIKLSRRYSNILLPKFYQYRLNQSMKHVIAYFIAIEIFIRKDPHKKYSNSFMLDVNSIFQKVHYETRKGECKGYSLASKLDGFKSIPNKLRTYKMTLKYINEILADFVSNKTIYDYEVKYDYDETEDFQEKRQYDYDLAGNLIYNFTLDDVNRDVDVSFLIYLDSPINHL